MLKNVIILIDAAHVNGGASKVALMSAVGLSRKGYHVVVVSSVPPIDKVLEDSGVKVVCTGQPDILSHPNRIKASIQGLWNSKAKETFLRVLKDYSPEDTIIHFHEWSKALSASLWSVMIDRKYKVIVTLHEYFLFCPNGGLYNYRKKKICTLTASSTKCYLCNCDSRNYFHKLWRVVRQIIQNRIVDRNPGINFIYLSETSRRASYHYLNGIAANWFYLRNPIELNSDKRVDIIQNDTYLFVGRVSSEKGIRLFCEAITELNLKGCVIGDGPLKEKMEKAYPNIRFTGWVTGEQKDMEIRKGKALVFPSLWYECAPLTILEMKSYGLPCIVPDICAASEEVKDGKTGFIFKSGELDSLKKAISKLERSDLKAMQCDIATDFDKNLYSLETHCAGLQEIYQRVMDSPYQHQVQRSEIPLNNNAKLLSIIVPTYNMEHYLRMCLDSLLVSDENMALLEVLIINDGSNDASSVIGHSYESDHPQTFRVIDKENGNYGSCINRGLKEARGKYVRILDADDYYQTSNLNQFISMLNDTDADLVLSDMVSVYADDKEIRHSFGFGIDVRYDNRLLGQDEFMNKMEMHHITYKKTVLDEVGYTQTEGISYTDQEWTFYPMIGVRSIAYFPETIYEYMLGREGQTMSIDVELERVGQKIIIAERMMAFMKDWRSDNSALENYLKCRLRRFLRLIYKQILLYQTDEQYLSHKDELVTFDQKVRNELPPLYEEVGAYVISSEIPLKFVRHWRHNGRRYPRLVLNLHKSLKSLDICLRKMHIRK